MTLISKISDYLLKVESKFSALLIGFIVLLILLNVFTRSIGYAIYWVDELVVYLMVWMVFITMPMLIALNKNISVDLVFSFLGSGVTNIFMLFTEIILLSVSVFMVYLSIGWFMPFELYDAGFDFSSFSEITFNYIYEEPTSTLPVRKYLFWLVVPASSLLCCIHSISNLIELSKNSK